MANLNSTIELDYKKFLRWWWRELSFFIPEKIKQLITNEVGLMIISPHKRQFLIHYQHNEQSELIATLERSDSNNNLFKNYCDKDPRLAKAKIVLRLNASQAVTKQLALPLAAKENLAQVVAYELDKYTPFKAEQVYFAVQLLASDTEAGLLKVLLILTTREVIDTVYDDLKALGIIAQFVDVEGTHNDIAYGDNPYNLLPERLREKTDKTPRLLVGGLISAMLLLSLGTLIMPVWFEYQTVQLLDTKIKSIEKEAKSIKAQQQEIDDMMDESRQLIAEKTAAPPVIKLLNELSLLIKDDTSLAYLQYSEGHLQIQGESPVASNLIKALEDSDLFSNTRFVSPVTQDTVSKLERFQITVDSQGAKKMDENGDVSEF
ncbi:MAG: PilN domain-containing protein [Methylococcaceae bacterium]